MTDIETVSRAQQVLAQATCAKDKELYNIHPDFNYSCAVIESTLNKIKSKISIQDNGCWFYLGCITNNYGRITIKVKTGSKSKAIAFSTHKFMYRYYKGSVSEYELIRHKCNNSICCNPDHLQVGSFLDNVMDRMRKNDRHRRI